jgi:hypothetical protein
MIDHDNTEERVLTSVLSPAVMIVISPLPPFRDSTSFHSLLSGPRHILIHFRIDATMASANVIFNPITMAPFSSRSTLRMVEPGSVDRRLMTGRVYAGWSLFLVLVGFAPICLQKISLSGTRPRQFHIRKLLNVQRKSGLYFSLCVTDALA